MFTYFTVYKFCSCILSAAFIGMCSIGEGDYGDDGAVHAMPVTETSEDTLDMDQICKKCNAEKVCHTYDSFTRKILQTCAGPSANG